MNCWTSLYASPWDDGMPLLIIILPLFYFDVFWDWSVTWAHLSPRERRGSPLAAAGRCCPYPHWGSLTASLPSPETEPLRWLLADCSWASPQADISHRISWLNLSRESAEQLLLQPHTNACSGTFAFCPTVPCYVFQTCLPYEMDWAGSSFAHGWLRYCKRHFSYLSAHHWTAPM